MCSTFGPGFIVMPTETSASIRLGPIRGRNLNVGFATSEENDAGEPRSQVWSKFEHSGKTSGDSAINGLNLTRKPIKAATQSSLNNKFDFCKKGT